jgi:hypothetical protein
LQSRVNGRRFLSRRSHRSLDFGFQNIQAFNEAFLKARTIELDCAEVNKVHRNLAQFHLLGSLNFNFRRLLLAFDDAGPFDFCQDLQRPQIAVEDNPCKNLDFITKFTKAFRTQTHLARQLKQNVTAFGFIQTSAKLDHTQQFPQGLGIGGPSSKNLFQMAFASVFHCRSDKEFAH